MGENWFMLVVGVVIVVILVAVILSAVCYKEEMVFGVVESKGYSPDNVGIGYGYSYGGDNSGGPGGFRSGVGDRLPEDQRHGGRVHGGTE